jgi:hypothetical protein
MAAATALSSVPAQIPACGIAAPETPARVFSVKVHVWKAGGKSREIERIACDNPGFLYRAH